MTANVAWSATPSRCGLSREQNRDRGDVDPVNVDAHASQTEGGAAGPTAVLEGS